MIKVARFSIYIPIRQGKSLCKLALVTTYVLSFGIDRRDQMEGLTNSAKRYQVPLGQGDAGGVTPSFYGQ